MEAHENGVGDTNQGRQDGLADAKDHKEHQSNQPVSKELVLWQASCLRGSLEYTHI